MSPFLQASLLGSDNSSEVCFISNRMFTLRFAPTGNFWSKDSFRGPVPSSVPSGPALPLLGGRFPGKARQELTLLSLSYDSILCRARVQQERAALVSVQGREKPFVSSPPWSVTATAAPGHPEVLSPSTAPGPFLSHAAYSIDPQPTAKISVHYSWLCFKQQWTKTFSLKVLWSENNVFQVRCKHCKR